MTDNMGRGPGPLRQSSVAAAVKAVRAAGLDVDRVAVDRDGKIVIETPTAPAGGGEPDTHGKENPWDDHLGIRSSPKPS